MLPKDTSTSHLEVTDFKGQLKQIVDSESSDELAPHSDDDDDLMKDLGQSKGPTLAKYDEEEEKK
jgi:hypothetical protein